MQPLNAAANVSYTAIVGLMIAFHKAQECGAIQDLVETGYLKPDQAEAVADAITFFVEG